MLKKSRLKKKILTAMVMATLCSSSAYAMPTGGTVVSGNVTNVANPAELMTANANSIINWDSFSIAVGEKVSFDTRNFMVLNRVVGGQESQLLGMLSDQGNGKLILINPNGIVIGDNAIINVNDLTLSTLSLSNYDFQKLINGEMVEFSEVKDGKISIGSNANLTLGEALRLYGGKITIADGVEIVSKENIDTNIQMIASNGVVTNFKNSTLSYVGADKSIEIGKATIGTMNNSVSNVDIRADKLSLDGSGIVVNGQDSKVHNIFISGNDANIKNSSLINRKGTIIAVGPYTWHVWYDSNGNIDKFELATEPGNQITIKDSLVNTVHDDITILGADVTLEGAKINSGKNIFVGAVNQYNSEKGVQTATSHDTSTLKADENTVINARGYAEAYGKILDIKARKFDNVVIADNPFIKVMNDQGLTLDKLADILKEHPEYEDVISDILNTKYQINIKDVDNISDNYYHILQQFSPEEREILYAIAKGEHIEDPRAVEIVQRYYELASSDSEINKYYLPSYSNVSGSFATGGMYISDIKTSKINSDGNINVTLNIYNWTPIPGIIEVYDKNGNLKTRKWIDGHDKYSESVSDAMEDVGKLFKDIVHGTALSHKSEALSELNEFSGNNTIVVPEGGRIRITNNEDESPELKLHNNLLNLIDWIFTAKDVLDFAEGANTKEVRNLTTDVLTNKILNSFKDWDAITKDKFLKTICKNEAENVYGLVTEMKGFGIDVDRVIEQSLNETFEIENLEKTAIKTGMDIFASMSDVAHIQEGMFLINSGLNKERYQRYREQLSSSKPIEYQFFNGEAK